MSLPQEVPATDLSAEDLERVRAFQEAGMPGLAHATPVVQEKMQRLYMSGRSYAQVARATNSKKDLVLYLAHREGWYAAKVEASRETLEQVARRVAELRTESAMFMADVVTCWNKYMGGKALSYLSTGNPADAAEVLYNKNLPNYIKSVELLEKLAALISSGGDGGGGGAGGGSGQVLLQMLGGQVHIGGGSEPPSSFAQALKAMADQARAGQARPVPSDIVDEDSADANNGVRVRKKKKETNE